jgi:hypothetical protein
VIPPEMMECLNKTEWRQIKLLLGKTQPALYYAWGEDSNKALSRLHTHDAEE